jgi:hypothetical protein
LLSAALLAAPLAGADPPARRALLIGINEYKALPDLYGAVNDVELMRGILTTQLGFDERNVRTILDEQATRAGIVAALEELVASAGPDDVLYIHYSGHGSQVPDTNGDETEDTWDETLVPHDGRSVNMRDITDDELAEIVSRSATDDVVIVLDSCHSGTATRSALAVVSRVVPRDERKELYETGVRQRAVVPVIGQRHVLITAASSFQPALDGPVDGRAHGLFTYALGRALSGETRNVSARDVLEGAHVELERLKGRLGLRDMPEPQLEAPASRLDDPLIRPAPADTAARLPWVATQPAAAAGEARLVDAVALGALPGSLWAVYPPGETVFPPGDAVAIIDVERTAGADAIGVLDPPGVPIAAASRAVALAPPPVGASVPVLWVVVEGEPRSAVRAEIEQLLPELVWAEPGDFARFVVEIERGTARVFGADGQTKLAEFETEDDLGLAASLATLFARWLTTAELLAIDNPASSIALDLRVASADAGQIRVTTARGVSVVSGPGTPVFRVRATGTERSPENSLQLRVETSRDCYLTLVDVDAEGQVQAFFPNPIPEQRGFHPQGQITAGEAVLIPDGLEPGNRAGFYVDYAPPPGTDTIRAFCNTDLATAAALRDQIARISTAPGGGVGTRSTTTARSVLADVLRPQLARVASRGLVLVPDKAIVPDAPLPDPVASAGPPATPESPAEVVPETQVRDWAAASVTVRVEP